MPTDRPTLRALRTALCPAGVVLVDPALHPAARGASTGLVFAVGTVTTGGSGRHADELELLLSACLERDLDPATYLAPYAAYLLAVAPTRPDRLSGRAAAAFLDQQVRGE